MIGLNNVAVPLGATWAWEGNIVGAGLTAELQSISPDTGLRIVGRTIHVADAASTQNQA